MPSNSRERPFSLVFFAARIYHRDVKLSYLKCIWPFQDPTVPERFEVVNGLDTALLDSDLDKLTRGRRFLWETFTRGKPTGTTNWTREDFLYELPRTRQKLRMRYGRKPFDNEIAAEMGISAPTYGRYKKRFLRNPS
jgi:hypothetical protein